MLVTKINNKQDKVGLHINDEITKITISDIRNWIPKKDLEGYKLFIDEKEVCKFSEKLYGNWSQNLIDRYDTNSDDELNPYRALMLYSGSGYKGINEYLRYGIEDYNDMVEHYNHIIENIDISFSNVPRINENIIVFRRIGLCKEGRKDYFYSLKEEDKIKDKAYMSTSLILDIAVNIHEEEVDSSYALLIIKIPKGENCIFINTLDEYPECEVLISRNKVLKLEKILVKNDKQIVLLCTL